MKEIDAAKLCAKLRALQRGVTSKYLKNLITEMTANKAQFTDFMVLFTTICTLEPDIITNINEMTPIGRKILGGDKDASSSN